MGRICLGELKGRSRNGEKIHIKPVGRICLGELKGRRKLWYFGANMLQTLTQKTQICGYRNGSISASWNSFVAASFSGGKQGKVSFGL